MVSTGRAALRGRICHMKKAIVLVLLAVFALTVIVLAQGTSVDVNEVRRYQLQQISEFGPQLGAAPTTVVLDTKTGQLWKLVTMSCPDSTQRQGWAKLPGLGKNELTSFTFSCQ